MQNRGNDNEILHWQGAQGMCDCGISSGPSIGDDSIKINSSKFDDLFCSIFHPSIISVLHRVIFLFV